MKNSGIIKVIGIGLAAVVLLCGSVFGQEDTKNNKDKTSRSNATVNPTSLGLELSIPLGNVPGRAGNSLPITFNYSSKVWRMGTQTIRLASDVPPDTYAIPIYNEDSDSGWTTSLQAPYFEESSIIKTSNPIPNDGGGSNGGNGGELGCVRLGLKCNFSAMNSYNCWEIFICLNPNLSGESYPYQIIPKFTLHLPDGSTHEMVSTLTPISVAAGQLPPPQNEYFSIDGSNLKYKTFALTGTKPTLFMPNGSRYEFENDVNVYNVNYFDADGNQLAYSLNRNGNHTLANQIRRGEWTDTLGRIILPPKPPTDPTDPDHPTKIVPGNVEYNVPSLPNQPPMKYIFRWKRLENSFAKPSYVKKYMRELFYGVGIAELSEFNPVILQEIEQPNGKKYQLLYNEYGEIEKIIYPTGSSEEFAYQTIAPFSYGIGQNSNNQLIRQGNRGVVQRIVKPDSDSSHDMTWKYEVPHDSYFKAIAPYRVITTAPDLSYTERYLFASPQASTSGAPILPSQMGGKPYEERSYDKLGRLVSRSFTKWTGLMTSNNSPIFAYPKVERTMSISVEGDKALATMSESEYDSNAEPMFFAQMNVKRAKSYGYVPLDLTTAQTGDFASIQALFTPDKLVSISEMEYLYDLNYKARGILGLPVKSRLLNPTNPDDILAESQAVYDEQGQYYSMSDSGTTTGYEAPGGTYPHLRGHPTTKKTWDKDTQTWIVTHTQFDNFGNVRKVWDTSGDQSRFIETVYDPTYKYAYPTKVKAPAPDPTGSHGMTEGSEINRVYDFNTGLLMSVTDANNQTATTDYDSLLRPIRVNPPSGGSVSETEYHDDNANLWVKSRQQLDENNWAEKTTYFDSLGRAYKSRTKDLQGDVETQVKFDNLGRVKASSNPYRVNASGQPAETVFWSKPRYDELNRAVESYAPAAVDPDLATAHGASLGTVEFGISTEPNLVGAYTTAKDASGRKSRTISGIYGILRVDEATGIGGTTDADLGPIGNPNQPTSYTYNIKGEMIKITQGKPEVVGQPVQYRHFMYDSLGRLIRVKQPEQTPNPNLATTGNPGNNDWTAGYSYNVLGNVVRVTDAKGINIINEYDAASRPTVRCYSKANINTVATQCNGLTSTQLSDDTPSVNYFYDGKGLPNVPQFSRGALTKVTNTVSEDYFTSFDNHGRLLASQQVTDGQTYDFGYKYNLSGGLLEEKYPSGRIVRNFLDNDGGLSLVTSKSGNGQVKQVASNFDYSATGDVRKMKLGNGLWETSQVDERFQLKQVGLGTTATNNDLFKIDYEYGELNDNGTVDTSRNIGMIAKTTTTIPTTSFTQTFKYDAINRLTEAKELAPNNAQNWKQTFGYDIFGNRNNFTQVVGTTTLATNTITKPTIDQSNNQFTTGQGYLYDFNGNLIQDAEGRSFKFDGNDKQVEVKSTNNPTQIIGNYYYDASGARVKKVVGNETTIFVYDAGGALAAEYSINAPTPTTTPTTSYMTTDHLGSPRVITDKNGQVISRRDFMPFGEEIYAGVGGRNTTQKYANFGSDNIRKRYTGYEKDDETQLDFAEARMYQNKHGRFTAVDPLMASASAGNPQTFNRYTYTGNNPVNYADPSGLDYCRAGNGNLTYISGSECGDKGTNVTGTYGEITSGGTVNGQTVPTGAVVFVGSSSLTIIKNPTDAQRDAATRQSGIQSATVDVETSNADQILTTENGNVGGTITNRPLEPEPCAPSYQCAGARSPEERAKQAEDFGDFVGGVPGGVADGAKGTIDLPNTNPIFIMPGSGQPVVLPSLSELGLADPWFNYNYDRPMNGPQRLGNLSGRGIFQLGLGYATGRVIGAGTKFGAFSTYEDITVGKSVTNIGTNVTKAEFINTLEKNGFSSTTSKNGLAINLEKGALKYSIRDSAKAGNVLTPTAGVFTNGNLFKKIRLGGK